MKCDNDVCIVSKNVGSSRRRPEGSSFIWWYPKVGQGTTHFPGHLRPLTPTCWYSFIDLGRMKGWFDLSVMAGNRTRAVRIQCHEYYPLHHELVQLYTIQYYGPWWMFSDNCGDYITLHHNTTETSTNKDA